MGSVAYTVDPLNPRSQESTNITYYYWHVVTNWCTWYWQNKILFHNNLFKKIKNCSCVFFIILWHANDNRCLTNFVMLLPHLESMPILKVQGGSWNSSSCYRNKLQKLKLNVRGSETVNKTFSYYIYCIKLGTESRKFFFSYKYETSSWGSFGRSTTECPWSIPLFDINRKHSPDSNITIVTFAKWPVI